MASSSARSRASGGYLSRGTVLPVRSLLALRVVALAARQPWCPMSRVHPDVAYLEEFIPAARDVFNGLTAAGFEGERMRELFEERMSIEHELIRIGPLSSLPWYPMRALGSIGTSRSRSPSTTSALPRVRAPRMVACVGRGGGNGDTNRPGARGHALDRRFAMASAKRYEIEPRTGWREPLNLYVLVSLVSGGLNPRSSRMLLRQSASLRRSVARRSGAVLPLLTLGGGPSSASAI